MFFYISFGFDVVSGFWRMGGVHLRCFNCGRNGELDSFFNSLGLALRDVKDLLCRRDAYMGAVWKAERCFIKI